MARIETYVLDTVLNASDKLIGTDAAKGANNATKNFTVGTLKEFINTGIPDPTDPTDAVNQGYVADNVVNGGSISGTTLTLTRTGELDDVTITGVGQVQSLTTTGASGAATLTNGVLNIPQYSGGGGDAYTDTNVNTHLNTGSANANEVLSWTGSDYDWVAQQGTDGITGTSQNVATTAITEIKTLTQAQYDAITNKSDDIMYVIL